METLKKITPIIILVIGILILYQVFASNSKLQTAIKTLDGTKKKLDSAALEVKYSKTQVDSLHQSLARFSAYIIDIQGRLERLDLEKRINDQSFHNKRDSIQVRLKELNKTVDLTGEALPEVKVIDTKTNTTKP